MTAEFVRVKFKLGFRVAKDIQSKTGNVFVNLQNGREVEINQA